MSLCYSFTLFSVKENFLFFFFLRLTWALHMNKHFALLMKGHCTNVCLHLLILCVLFNIRIFHWDLTSSNGSIQTFIRVAQFRMFSMRFHRWNLWFQICLNWISFSNTTEYSNANFLDAEPGKHSLLIKTFFNRFLGRIIVL